MQLVAATHNKHKLEEIDAITKKFGFELLSEADVGLGDFEPEETGSTFAENSLMKAKAICERSGLPTIADDSGLMVDALDGAPGVFSARYAGEHGDDAANNAKLLKELNGVPMENRKACFTSVITVIWPKGTPARSVPVFAVEDEDGYLYIQATGSVDGHILEEPEGDNGFGYDPLFRPMFMDHSFAVLGADIKNLISHRANALTALQTQLGAIRTNEQL